MSFVVAFFTQQFRRTAVAVAIAGIAASIPQIASADTVLSGAIGIQIGADDEDELINPPTEAVPADPVNFIPAVEANEGDPDGPTTSDGEFALDEAVIGIVATHKTNFGVDAYGSVRFDGEGFSGSNVSSDNIYLGVKGAFGDVRVGEVPVGVEYGQVANDIFAVNSGSDAGISYTGGFGPATIGVNYSPSRNEDQIGIGARFNLGGFAVGVGAQDRDDLAEYTIGASYGIAGASVAAHFASSEVDGGADDTEIIGVRIGYGFAGVSASLTYMIRTTDILGGSETEDEAVRVDLSYGLGGGFGVSGRWTNTTTEFVDEDTGAIDDVDIGEYRLLLTKSF